MITRIEATRYRCFELLDADLDTFCVLVGANGAGKTTFLDIPLLLGDCLAQREVGHAFTARLHGRSPRSATLNELIFRSRGTDFVIAIEAALPDNIVTQLLPSQSGPIQNNDNRWIRFARYEVRFEVFNDRQLTIANEYLFLFARATQPARGAARLYGEVAPHRDWRFVIQRPRRIEPSFASSRRKSDRAKEGNVAFMPENRKGRQSRPVQISGSMLALPRVQFEPAEEYPAARWLHDLLTEQVVFYQPDIQLLQSASPPGMSAELIPNAANLPWLALDLQKDKKRYASWVEHVKTALSQVDAIRAREREEDHHAYLALTYGGGYEVTSSGLSEGTLRILALTILPYITKRPSVIVTEEPENGIHPRAIEAILQSISSIRDSQLAVSSHSPIVLAASHLDQVLCARLDSSGVASIVRGTEHPRLKDWQGTIDLGSLFAAGVLG